MLKLNIEITKEKYRDSKDVYIIIVYLLLETKMYTTCIIFNE